MVPNTQPQYTTSLTAYPGGVAYKLEFRQFSTPGVFSPRSFVRYFVVLFAFVQHVYWRCTTLL